MNKTISQRIAEEISAHDKQVIAAVQLLDEGATVPFISRYRKEITGGLDDTQLRLLEERLGYLRELEDRRTTILKSISDQGKLTPELAQSVQTAATKTDLEDLYLPYKPKRRSKAQIAREAGLEPLALSIFADATLEPEHAATAYVNVENGVADVKAALDGARHILMEKFAEEAELLGKLREYLWTNGILKSLVAPGKEEAGAKFSDYFDYSEAVRAIPSHRALALFRGRNEDILQLNLILPEELEDTPKSQHNTCERMIAQQFNISDAARAGDKWLLDTVRYTWRIKIFLHLDVELMMRLKESAELEAIKVFARNLHDLLLAAPAGPRAILGLDPGLRTGVKVAVVDVTGKMVDTATIYPHAPRNDWNGSLATLSQLAKKHRVELISIGNGTASRETDKLAIDLIKLLPELNMNKIVVSEAGASIYSASEFAAKEFPHLDVTLRGAVSIARRLQDPLAELVKIDPKSIGVGQYQHDVSQPALARSLDAVVEDCVNAVGVDVNTASVPLLTRVSGLNATLAKNIVDFRDQNGAFKTREQLRKVPRLGDKTFEQAAGFLRIMNGSNPLDASSVHPEAYPLVERIVASTQQDIKQIIGNTQVIQKLDARQFTDENFGIFTVTDILRELEKPGRDPRPEFKTATFQEGVENLKDLTIGMVLEGVVTNVTNFGAFVDIGVHQDGLVHISMLAEKFVKDPHTVVKAGDIVKVKVLEVDEKRKRVALTMRMNDAVSTMPARAASPSNHKAPRKPEPQVQNGAMAAAFAKLSKK